MADLQTSNLSFTVNSNVCDVEVGHSVLLIDLLRDQLGLKGTKRSCDMQVCGTCTVLVDDLPVSSCTMLALDVEGRQVTTIEGVSTNGKLSRVQQAFVDHAALQCGFCTPGMVLAVTALLKSNPHPSEADIRHYLHGNICRCTGYIKILEAVKSLV